MFNKYQLNTDERRQFQFYAAISRLKQLDDFKQINSLLKQLQAQIDKQNRTAPIQHFQWGQGAAQFLDDLLAMIGDAESLRDKVREKSEKASG